MENRDFVALEFVREDFMGAKAKLELKYFQKERKQAREEGKKQALEIGAKESSAPFKLELLKAQSGTCFIYW